MADEYLLESDLNTCYPSPLSLPMDVVRKPVHRVLFTSWSRIDSFIDGFSSSKLTLVDNEASSFARELVSMLCVRSIEDFGGMVVYVDGGNSIDPYRIAEFSRRRNLLEPNILSKILVSRAFTAYQMTTIITDRLYGVIQKYNPPLLIVSGISDLFLDSALKTFEAKSMLHRCLKTIEDLTVKNNLITVITNNKRPNPRRNRRYLPLQKVLYDSVDETLCVKSSKNGLKMKRGDSSFIDLILIPNYQTTLNEFGAERLYGAYCSNV